MVSGSTCNDVDSRKPIKFFFRKRNTVQLNQAVFIQPAVKCFADCFRLFMDFLQHEMAVAFFFRSVRIPCNVEDISLHRISLFIVYFDFICGHNDHLAVFNQINFFAMFHQCRNIGGNEILALADSCNQRRIFTDCNDFVRVFARHDNKRICPSHFKSCCIHSILKCRIIFHVCRN